MFFIWPPGWETSFKFLDFAERLLLGLFFVLSICLFSLFLIYCSCINFSLSRKVILDMVKHELRVASYEFQVESLKARVTSSNPRVTSSNPRVTSSNPRVTSSNPRVTSSNPRVQESLNQ